MVRHRRPTLSATVSSKAVPLLQHCLGSSSPSFCHMPSTLGLTISPSVKINDYTLEVVEDFTYLGSNISNNLSLDTEINRRIGKAACTMAKLTKRVWENKMLTDSTIHHVVSHARTFLSTSLQLPPSSHTRTHAHSNTRTHVHT